MPTLSGFLSARAAAGARYAAAITELQDAYVDLHATDKLLQNDRVRLPAMQLPVRTFHGFPQVLDQAFSHPVFAPDVARNLDRLVDQAFQTKLATLEEA